MKNLFLLLFVVIVNCHLIGQSIIEKHYSALENDESATVVKVSGNLFGYVSKVMPEEEEDAKKIKDILSNIESFSLIKVPNLDDANAEYNKGVNTLSRSHESLIIVRDKKTKFSLYIDEEDDVIREIAGVGRIDTSFIAFSLIGNISLDQLSDITEMIQKQDAMPFSDDEKQNIVDFKVYPNPVAKSSMLKVDVPESLIGGNIHIIDMNGQLIKSVAATNENMEISVMEANLGSYVVEILKDDLSMRKQVLVIE